MTVGSRVANRRELLDLSSRLRSYAALQGVLHEGGPVSAAAVAPSSAPPPTPRRPQPAARVMAARAVAAQASPEPSPAPSGPSPAQCSTLAELHDAFASCDACELAGTRTRFVFGTGNPNAGVLFVGEAPGRDEDLQGEPFVGRAGQLLDRILAAVGFDRKSIYIANILKCRPPGNRDPLPQEISACRSILNRQVELIRPVVICTLGSFAARTLLSTSDGISRLRGRIHEYRGVPVIPTYHPAALLRNERWKRPVWEDVQVLRREYDQRSAQADPDPSRGMP
ncbi:MAG: uracil-DNA glycosylase [Gemmatimonadota bacterium]|jgi:DNA polymerase|nr:uracil-DNA glycosylase [Gemmatimonadota bacterium]MDP6528618.1 uracil-DNA glycosylase [Gemmatimonadota bacterium]MDP6803291.1 uracil-DNA glycosylase [Gemmatimonadota bacterium]